MMLIVIWCVVCSLIFVFIVNTVLKKGSDTQKFLVGALMFLSVPVLYLIERGNIIVLSLISLMIYGVLMLIIPSFFFGGPMCFYQLFINIFNFSSGE